MMAVVTVNAQSPKKDGVYNFTKPTTALPEYFSKDKLNRLAAPKTIWENNISPKRLFGITYYSNPYGKSGLALVGTTGWTVGKHVATSMVATIGSSIDNAHLSGVCDYDLSQVDGLLHGTYSTRSLQCKTLDFGLANQWEVGQIRLFKKCALSVFGGIFVKVSVEHGTETYVRMSYVESIPSAYYQGGYDYFILSCGSQLGLNLKLGKWTLSVSENLTNGLWRNCTRPLGPDKTKLIDVSQDNDDYHPLSTNVGVTFKIG